MKNEPEFETFRRTFSSRINVASAISEALNASQGASDRLTEACLQFDTTISAIGNGDVEDQYRAYGMASGLFALLAEWKQAIRRAEPESYRFLAAAKMKASEIDRDAGFAQVDKLLDFLAKVDNVQTPADLDDLQARLCGWSLPPLLFAKIPKPLPDYVRAPGGVSTSNELDTTVAFLRFDIDGQPAKHWNHLKPRTAYDLSIEVRVSNWPQGATTLSLVPVTLDSRERDWLPKFLFAKPDGGGPFTLTGIGRAVLETANSFGSRPYEFLYAAEFNDLEGHRKVEIVGHRRLLLEGTDVDANPLTGFPNVDRHLRKVRDRLRSFAGLNVDDLANAMVILGGFGSIAASALQDAIFEADTTEREFQKEVTARLRMRPDIGSELNGHPAAAGGITDLTFRHVPIELKVENSKVLSPKDFANYFDQTAAYALGLGKKIAILSVLDSCAKNSPIGDVEKDIDIFSHQVGNSAVVIAVVVIRGGLPRPSSYSR
ncbi:hypothetical protein [Rhizobium sp. AG207R]|uniref:hypothetical protein n=1 Tax=Rhizobium sp. AG207R TaxID=2802287 RepID=UPI0022AC859A|nr:hypothetical protein [Rhizobium sp. AG207R]MCZ3378390.1 hypothetical protein [Rhizobium sp. AG207R]